MTYCTSCGTPRESGEFCTGCGKQVSATPSPSRQGEQDGWETDTPTRPRGRLVVTLAALSLLLGIGGVAAWATLTRDADAPALPSPATPPDQPPAEGSTSYVADSPSGVDSTGTALDQLTAQISLDRPEVARELAEAWVPQLSSKRSGLVVDGISYDYTDILKDHLALRSTYSARLVWSGDWSTFREKDFYVTMAAVPFSTPADANAWCESHAIDSDNCFAKRLSTLAGPEGSTVNR